MPPVKPMATIATKWKNRVQGARQDYADGVANTPKSWASRTAAAATNYEAGVTAAIAAGKFASGVAKAGDAKWKQNTVTKGPDRWAQGVRLAVDNYNRGFAPFRQVIESTDLPERGPRGSAQNFDRSRIMGETLHAAKNAGLA